MQNETQIFSHSTLIKPLKVTHILNGICVSFIFSMRQIKILRLSLKSSCLSLCRLIDDTQIPHLFCCRRIPIVEINIYLWWTWTFTKMSYFRHFWELRWLKKFLRNDWIKIHEIMPSQEIYPKSKYFNFLKSFHIGTNVNGNLKLNSIHFFFKLHATPIVSIQRHLHVAITI